MLKAADMISKVLLRCRSLVAVPSFWDGCGRMRPKRILWAAVKETLTVWPIMTSSLDTCWETLFFGKCEVFLVFTQTIQCVRHPGLHKTTLWTIKRLSSLKWIWQMSLLTGTITGFPHVFIKSAICLIARRSIFCHVGEPDQSKEWIASGIFTCFYHSDHCPDFACGEHQDALDYCVLIASLFSPFI